MELLEALAAFALAMLLFSTTVSAILEVVLNRILKLRQRGFRKLLERVYDDVLAPKLQAGIEGIKSSGRDPRQEFVDTISRNPGVSQPNDGPRSNADGKLEKARRNGKEAVSRVGSLFTSGRIAALDAVQFAERFADTEIGKIVSREARARRDVLIDDLALKFERFGEGTREYFSQRSRTISIFAAIAIALLANIDASMLFEGFLKDPMARSAFLARAETISEAYARNAAGATAPSAKAPTPPPGDTDLPADAAATPLRGAADAESDADKSVEELRELAETIKTQITDLESMSLKVGWAYFPWCDAEQMTEAEATAIQRLGGFTKAFETKTETLWVGARAVDSRCKKRFRVFEKEIDECVGKKNASNTLGERVAECLDEETGAGSVVATLNSAPIGVAAAWVFYCVVAGFLIGLGGPFWFNVYSNLSRVLQVARQVRGVIGPRKGKEEKKADAGEAGARKPANPVEAFDRAAAANDISPRSTTASEWEAWRARMRGRVVWIQR